MSLRYIMAALIAFGTVALLGSFMLRQRALAPVPTRAAPAATVPVPSATPQPFRYVALGDSTVYGTGASSPENSYVARLSRRLDERGFKTETLNLGVNGATSANVVADQLERAIAAKPHLVTLSVGPNDLTQGRDVNAYERDIETIFRTLHEQTNALVVANNLPDLGVAPRLDSQQRALATAIATRYNTAFERQAQKYGVVVVDLFAASRAQVPGNPQLLSQDLYHPSDEGYARWAELMWQSIEPHLR